PGGIVCGDEPGTVRLPDGPSRAGDDARLTGARRPGRSSRPFVLARGSMILTGPAIHREQRRGTLNIEPFDPKHLNPNSYNFHLHSVLLCRPDATRRWTRE